MEVFGRAYTALVILVTVAYLAQGALAGQFLSGTYPALRLHQIVASSSDILLLLAIVAGALLRWLAKGRIWPFLCALALFAANQVQNLAGANRLIWLHIPLGMAMLAASVVIALTCMRPGALRRKA